MNDIDLSRIARGIREMVTGQHSVQTKAFLRRAFVQFFKELNQYPDYVSVKAKQKADELGIKRDLRTIQWPQQPREMRDPGRRIFLWEHIAPVTQVADDILDMDTPNDEKIEAKLRTLAVCWILRSEEARLSRSFRPDPFKAYADAGIEFFQYRDGMPRSSFDSY